MTLQLHPTEPPTPQRYAVILASAASFHPLDWTVLAAYMLLVIGVGVVLGRKHRGADEFFLAGRSMPMWAVAISVLATSLSAATFIGGPEQAYNKNLTYLAASIGGFIAIVVVALVFIPAFYRHRVTSIYELIGNSYGGAAQRSASAMFLVGRVFASGARLFMVAIPFSLIAFGTIQPGYLVASIIVIAFVASLYTIIGGIRAVIWTDVLQAILIVVTVGFAITTLLSKIPLSLSEIVGVLGETKVGDTTKLTFIDTSLDPSKWFTIWSALIGWTLFSIAAYGTDQDLAQRMLTCRSARSGSWSAVVSHLISWPIVASFLFLGLLLFVLYQRPDLMGTAAVDYEIDDTRKVFLEFILNEMGVGVRGLMLAGLFASAMSSFDSALNAMASATVTDFYRPWIAARGSGDAGSGRRELLVSRIAVFVWAVVLAGFACLCVHWQQASGLTLIKFALSVMIFAYSGLLAVFLTALFTERGSANSVFAALATGFVCVLLMQDFAWSRWAPHVGIDVTLAMPWQMAIATAISFAVCCVGCGRQATSRRTSSS